MTRDNTPLQKELDGLSIVLKLTQNTLKKDATGNHEDRYMMLDYLNKRGLKHVRNIVHGRMLEATDTPQLEGDSHEEV